MTTSPAPVLRTERLDLLPFAPEDADALHALFVEPAVRRHLLDDEIVGRAWIEAEIARSQVSFQLHGHGLWKILPATGELIGFAGYREFFDPPELQLLYGLHPAWWGRGLATEAAAAVLAYGFLELGFDRVLASTDAENGASARVLERLGMRYRGREVVAGLDTLHYALQRADWAPAAPRTGPA